MKKARTLDLVKQLNWESDFFQIKCAEVIGTNMFKHKKELAKFDWTQGKASIGDKNRINSFERLGFKFEDLRITLQKKLSLDRTGKYHQSIRKAEIEDTSNLLRR